MFINNSILLQWFSNLIAQYEIFLDCDKWIVIEFNAFEVLNRLVRTFTTSH